MVLNSSQIIQEASYHGDQRDRLPVIGSNGITQVNGNYVIAVGTDIPINGRELFIANDGTGDMTITVNCQGGQLGFILKGQDTIDERFPSFSSVIVTSAGLWRWTVRGNLT